MLANSPNSLREAKYVRLLEFLAAKPGWIAFSGGVDSTLLLRAALEVNRDATVAIFADSPLQAQVDRENVRRIVDQLRAPLLTVPFDPWSQPGFLANPAARCYLCKKIVYGNFLDHLPAGFFLLDGTNLDDTAKHRPGRLALAELAIETPLLAVGLGKDEIRLLARDLGLPNWDRPSASCLATRVPQGSPITAECLRFIEESENLLRGYGFGHIRIRPLTPARDHLQIELAREEMIGTGFSQARQVISAEFRSRGVVRIDYIGRKGVFVNYIG